MTDYKGDIDSFLSNKIYINVKNLKDGNYELRIINNKKLIKIIKFKKQ